VALAFTEFNRLSRNRLMYDQATPSQNFLPQRVKSQSLPKLLTLLPWYANPLQFLAVVSRMNTEFSLKGNTANQKNSRPKSHWKDPVPEA
jgi:hypothetical protein